MLVLMSEHVQETKKEFLYLPNARANKQNPIDFIEAGDIGAAVGFKDIKTGYIV
jgi:translation elongation factor EF-G